MDKVLFRNGYLSIIEREGYTFSHEARSDGKIVSILPFRDTESGREYLARVEVCPAHNLEPERCSITGGIDPGKSPRQSCRLELKEEAGVEASEDDFIDLGQVRPSKSADTLAYIFAIDVTGREQSIPIGDGTKWESDATVEWVSFLEGLKVKDPLFIVAMVRLEGWIEGGTKKGQTDSA